VVGFFFLGLNPKKTTPPAIFGLSSNLVKTIIKDKLISLYQQDRYPKRR
jgi:hypothetical protein